MKKYPHFDSKFAAFLLASFCLSAARAQTPDPSKFGDTANMVATIRDAVVKVPAVNEMRMDCIKMALQDSSRIVLINVLPEAVNLSKALQMAKVAGAKSIGEIWGKTVGVDEVGAYNADGPNYVVNIFGALDREQKATVGYRLRYMISRKSGQPGSVHIDLYYSSGGELLGIEATQILLGFFPGSSRPVQIP